MTLLHEAVDAKKFDTRIIERNIARGRVSNDDAMKSVATLPDDAENAEFVSIEALANDGQEDSAQ